MVFTAGSVTPIVLLSCLFACLPHVGGVRQQFFKRIPAGLYYHKKLVQHRAVFSFLVLFIGGMVSTTVLQAEELGVDFIEVISGVFGMSLVLLFVFRGFTGTTLDKLSDSERTVGDRWQPGPRGVSRWLYVMLLLLALTLGGAVAFYSRMPDGIYLFGGMSGQGAISMRKNYVTVALPVLVEVMACCFFGFLSAGMLPHRRLPQQPTFAFFGRAVAFVGSMVGIWGFVTMLTWAGFTSYGELTVTSLYSAVGIVCAFVYAVSRSAGVRRLPVAQTDGQPPAEEQGEERSEAQ